MTRRVFGFLPRRWQSNLCVAFNRYLPWPKGVADYQAEIKTSLKAGFDWEIETAQDFFAKTPVKLDVMGKIVLDFGCGLAGATQWFMQKGAAISMGVDINLPSLRDVVTLFGEKQQPLPSICQGDGVHLPYATNSLDIISSIYVFEHLDNVAGVLGECWRVLKPGGQLFVVFPPYYSPWCAHVQDWILYPWPHVLFTEPAIADAVAILERDKHNFDHYNPHAQLPIEAEFNHVNKMTLAQFDALLQKISWSKVQNYVPAVAYESARFAWLGRVLRAFQREIFSSMVIGVYTK